MAEDTRQCPGCGGPMEITIGRGDGTRRYACEACGSLVVAVPVLRKLVGEGPARDLWAQLETGAPSEPAPAGAPACPFCGQPMASGAAGPGHGAACKACQVVWLDQPARASLTAAGTAPPAASGAPADDPARCANCGAPVEATWEEQCRYCGAALEAPTTVVLVPTGEWGGPAPTGGAAGRLVSDVADLLFGRGGAG